MLETLSREPVAQLLAGRSGLMMIMMSRSPLVLSFSYRPDGQQLAVAALNGEITIWDPKSATQTGSINGTYDLEAGRKDTDKVTAKQLAKAK